jgi:hypothetical protein
MRQLKITLLARGYSPNARNWDTFRDNGKKITVFGGIASILW